MSNRLQGEEKTWTGEELAFECAGRLQQLGVPSGRVALVGDSAIELIAAAVWLAQSRRDGLVLPSERLTEALAERLREQGFSLVEVVRGRASPPKQSVRPQEGRITLLTSGTTGEPKLVEHRWETLFTMAKVRASKAHNWLLTYQAGTYAWYQMLTLWLFVPNQALTVAAENRPVRLFQAAREHGVTAISATPTFWRLVFLQVPQAEVKQLKLEQITLGGEAVDQSILDQLHQLYPQAILTQIYASTEAGVCIVVRDGQEGFPVTWLGADGQAQASPGSPRLQLRDGFLWIQSPYVVGSHGTWLNSGDRVEIRGDRAIILGRAENAFINVGGAKVAAREVERILLQHPAILWCRVHGCPAPLVGELVGVDVVFRSAPEIQPESALVQYCAARMAGHMIPRFWNFLSAIPVTGTLKSKLA